jgi:AraC-like DNA-binding protein
MAFLALDLGCRGAAVGVLLLIATVLLRDGRGDTTARLSAALAISAAASAICTAPMFPPEGQWWSLPLLTLSWGTTTVFWLWARAAFDDDFVLRRWHGGLWAAFVGLGLFVSYGWGLWPALGRTIDRVLSVTDIALPLLAIAQTLATWQADLVAGRRRLRFVVLVGTLANIAVPRIIASVSVVHAGAGWSMASVTGAFGLLVLAIVAGWSLVRLARPDQASQYLPVTGDVREDAGRAPAETVRPVVDPALLRRLNHLMTVERAYRQEGLTSGMLAGKLGLPDHRLRQLINEGLGHRNFNVFLNRYRIDEAKAALIDATQKEVPILTIAMDAGFRSIGPFNRAFKADTGQTPTEYRRAALAQAASSGPSAPSAQAQ